jgi:hypothetical protein
MNKKPNTLLFASATPGPNNHCALAVTLATEEFFHISPALITSSANKRGGIKQYLVNSTGNVHITTRDLQVGNDNGDAKAFCTSLNRKSGAN